MDIYPRIVFCLFLKPRTNFTKIKINELSLHDAQCQPDTCNTDGDVSSQTDTQRNTVL